MRFDREHVRRIAALARLQLEDADLDRLARELGQVLEHVTALENWPDADASGADPDAEPGAAPRADAIAFDPLAWPAAAMAPEFADGFFTVPRLEAFDGAPEPGDSEA